MSVIIVKAFTACCNSSVIKQVNNIAISLHSEKTNTQHYRDRILVWFHHVDSLHDSTPGTSAQWDTWFGLASSLSCVLMAVWGRHYEARQKFHKETLKGIYNSSSFTIATFCLKGKVPIILSFSSFLLHSLWGDYFVPSLNTAITVSSDLPWNLM